MHDTVLPGDSEVWSASLTQIPPLPPSFLVGCSIIDINYVLEVGSNDREMQAISEVTLYV